MKKQVFTIAFLLMICSAVIATDKCYICNAPLSEHKKTLHRASFDNQVRIYCSIYCLAYDLLKMGAKGKKAERIEAIDYATEKFLPVNKVYYLMETELPRGRGPYPLFAFGSAEDVMRIFLEKGGIVGGFSEAYGKANNRLDEYVEMLKREGRGPRY